VNRKNVSGARKDRKENKRISGTRGGVESQRGDVPLTVQIEKRKTMNGQRHPAWGRTGEQMFWALTRLKKQEKRELGKGSSCLNKKHRGQKKKGNATETTNPAEKTAMKFFICL